MLCPCPRFTGDALLTTIAKANFTAPLLNLAPSTAPAPSGNSPTTGNPPGTAVQVDDESGLSGGAIAGIVVGAVVGSLLVLGAVVLVVRRRQTVAPNNQLGATGSGNERLPGRHDPEGPAVVQAKMSPA